MVQDPRELLEREANDAMDEARARIRAAIEEATRDVLREIGDGNSLHEEVTGVKLPGASMGRRITRSDAARLFGVSMSKLRGMESRGAIHPRRKGGRIMLDPDEVAKALGVETPSV
jgi:hypothetical protein